MGSDHLLDRRKWEKGMREVRFRVEKRRQTDADLSEERQQSRLHKEKRVVWTSNPSSKGSRLREGRSTGNKTS